MNKKTSYTVTFLIIGIVISVIATLLAMFWMNAICGDGCPVGYKTSIYEHPPLIIVDILIIAAFGILGYLKGKKADQKNKLNVH